MKIKPTHNPYGLKDTAGFVKFARLVIWGGNAISLALFFFVYQLLVANSAPSFLTLTVFYLSECFSASLLFATLALLLLTVVHEEKALSRRLIWEESLALILLSLILRMSLYFLTAVLDNLHLFGGFYLNDVTLSYLLEAGGFNLIMRSLSAFFGVVTMLAVILVSFFWIKKRYAKGIRGKIDSMMKKIPILVYLAISVGFAIINTVMTVIDLGISLSFSVIFSLLLPYIEIAVLTLVGQYIVDEVIRHLEKN